MKISLRNALLGTSLLVGTCLTVSDAAKIRFLRSEAGRSLQTQTNVNTVVNTTITNATFTNVTAAATGASVPPVGVFGATGISGPNIAGVSGARKEFGRIPICGA